MTKSNVDGLTLDGYTDRLIRAIAMLQGDDFNKYPALTKLLDNSVRKETRRNRLIAVLDFIIKTIPSAAGTIEPSINKKTQKISSYKIAISESKLSEIWRVSQKTVISLSILFAETLLLKRQTSNNEQTIQYSRMQARLKTNNSESNTPIMYVYWIDEWTPGQLDAIEKKAQAWIDAGAPARIRKGQAINIWGQPSADAVSQSGAGKSKKKLLYEKLTIEAFDAVYNRSDISIVTGDKLKQELSRRIRIDNAKMVDEQAKAIRTADLLAGIQRTETEIAADTEKALEVRHKSIAEKCWKEGKERLLLDRGLEYRQLRKDEKEKYGLTDVTCWALIPHT